MTRSPYFDILVRQLAAGDTDTVRAFGRHVHWGAWPRPAVASHRQSQAPPTAEEFGQAAERLCQWVLDEALIEDGCRVLDVGCGFGGAVAMLNERHRGLRLTGVNIDPRQLSRAAAEVRPLAGNSIAWVEGDACRLPLPSDPVWDVVLAIECIFHFDSRAAFFREAASRLRPGGRIVISDFVPSSPLASYLRTNAGELPGQDSLAASYGAVQFDASLADYEQLAADAQLALTRSRDITAETLPTYDYLLASLERWEDRELAAHYRQATEWLAKVSRREMLAYQILVFEPAGS